LKRALPEPTMFADDDEGFLRWLREHPDGYVINAARGEHPREAWLHRAQCSQISQAKVALTKDYVKYCGPGRAVLREWCRTRLGPRASEGCVCL
jgi:hypothetical protein